MKHAGVNHNPSGADRLILFFFFRLLFFFLYTKHNSLQTVFTIQLSLRYFAYITGPFLLLYLQYRLLIQKIQLLNYLQYGLLTLLTIQYLHYLLNIHAQSYNYLHYILILRREEYFSINHPIKEKCSRSYLMSGLLIKY